jgi:hypothetical protein
VRHRKWCFLISAAFAGALLNPTVPGYCADNSSPTVLHGQVEADQEMGSILAEELEIERLSCQFDQASHVADFAKGRRQWSYNFGNAVCTEGGLIAATALFADHMHNHYAVRFQTTTKNGVQLLKAHYVRIPPAIDPNSVNATVTPQIVGQGISIVGGCYELMATLGVVMHRKQLGMSPREVDSAVLDHLGSIDRKLKLAVLNYSQSESSANELRVLEQLRNRVLSDYVTARLVEKRWSSWNNCQNVTGVIRNSIGAVGNGLNELGRHDFKRRLNGDGSILNFISASIILVRPYFCEVWGLYKERNLEHKLSHSMGNEEAVGDGSFEDDITRLTLSTNRLDRSDYLNKRLQIYATLSNDRNTIFEGQEKRTTVLSRRSMLRGSLYAPTKQTQSMINLVTQFRPRNDTAENNRFGFAANLTYASGQMYNISELSRQRVFDEVAHSRQNRAQILPTQLLAKRIASLSNEIHSISAP